MDSFHSAHRFPVPAPTEDPLTTDPKTFNGDSGLLPHPRPKGTRLGEGGVEMIPQPIAPAEGRLRSLSLGAALHFRPRLDRVRQRGVVGVFEVGPRRQAARQPGDLDAKG